LDSITDATYINQLNEEIIEYNQKALELDKPFDRELMQSISAMS